MFFNVKAERLLPAAVLLSLTVLPAHAQAVQTADQRVRIGFYGMLSYVHPDFLNSPNAIGVTAGVNVDGIRVLPYTDIGLDLRGANSHSNSINESSLSGGPRLSYSRYRLQPHAEYMFGLGRGGFNNSTDPDYQRDYTAIRSYGGGFDYQVSRNFGLRADVQRQRWRFTYMAPYFHPVNASIGISYRLHLHSRTGPQ